MPTLYFYCAVVGGSILVLQTILLLFAGADGDIDTDPDVDPGVDLHGAEHAGDVAHASDSFVKLLSFKTIIAFLTFFGLTGLACIEAEVNSTWTLIASAGAGFAAFYLVGWLMAMLSKLASDGTEDLTNAIGKQGKVYLRVPGNQGGIGKVTLTVQGRRVTRKAITTGDEIPTGTAVNIIALSGNDTLRVETVSTE